MSLFHVSSSVLAVSRTCSAIWNPVACSQEVHLPSTRLTCLAPATARVTNRLSSTRPRHVTGTTFSRSSSPSAAFTICSHAMTTSPSAARMA